MSKCLVLIGGSELFILNMQKQLVETDKTDSVSIQKQTPAAAGSHPDCLPGHVCVRVCVHVCSCQMVIFWQHTCLLFHIALYCPPASFPVCLSDSCSPHGNGLWSPPSMLFSITREDPLRKKHFLPRRPFGIFLLRCFGGSYIVCIFHSLL